MSKNARARLVDISNSTKIPIDTVKYRIKKMEENLVIRRYRLIVDSSKIGFTRYEIFIRFNSLSEKLINTLKEYFKTKQAIEFFDRLVGNWDIELTVHFKNIEELRKFILEVKTAFGENIRTIESLTLFETYKFSYLPEQLR
ncbi:Lrp/AsnC family transcriptional regulator [archaeon]|nr:Lrp/AsnC family transcriptional regulator [archaeon]